MGFGWYIPDIRDLLIEYTGRSLQQHARRVDACQGSMPLYMRLSLKL